MTVAIGSTGDAWFTESRTSQIGRITPNGVVTEFKTPTRFSKPFDIVRGPDDNMWFTEYSFGRIGRITADGSITEVHPPHFSRVYKICVGPDGALWFTGVVSSVNMIGRMTTTGQFAEFPIPAAWDITTGPDGNLWITGGNSVFRMTLTGSVTQFKTRFDAAVGDIVAGADGKLWFILTRGDGYEIGRMTTTGVFKEYPLGPSHVVTDIISAYGTVWFSLGASTGAGVASISKNGTTKEYLQSQCDQAYGLALSTDGNLWFSCYQSIDVFIKRILTVDPNTVTLTGNGQTQNLTVAEENYRGGWSASSSNPAVATVAPGSTNEVFVVTSHGVGSCTVTIRDARKNRVPVSVTVN